MSGAYEIALAQWGKDPTWIDENWSEEMLKLMFGRLIDRLTQGGE